MESMTVVTASRWAEAHDSTEVAPTRRRTPGPDGGIVPGRLAGYVYDGAHYCAECATDATAPAPDGDGEIPIAEYPAFETDGRGFGVGIVSGTDEIDYGGACTVCHRLLDTNVLLYGAEAERFSE